MALSRIGRDSENIAVFAGKYSSFRDRLVVIGVDRPKPISRLLVSSRNAPKVRLLSSTRITRLQQYYEPVRHPTRPGLLLTECRLRATTSHRRGFPCSDDFLFHACRRHYPGGTARCCRYHVGRRRPSLKTRQVGFRNFLFEACSAFTRVSACMVAKSPQVTRYTRVLQRICYLLAPLWLLPAERPIGRVGFAPTENRRLSRRTEFSERRSCTSRRRPDEFWHTGRRDRSQSPKPTGSPSNGPCLNGGLLTCRSGPIHRKRSQQHEGTEP